MENTLLNAGASSGSLDSVSSSLANSAQGNDNDEPIDPIRLLRDEMDNDEIAVRLNAIRRISTIALVLEPEKTREELIPMLNDYLNEEDEIMLALAEELGSFTPYIGGPSHIHLLFPVLEKLASTEEILVRDMAVTSLQNLGQILSRTNNADSKRQIDELFVPMTKRLAAFDWFTAKSSAAGLFACIYNAASQSNQEDLRKLFFNLAKDETPMVRRAVAIQFTKFIPKVSKEHLINDFLPIIKIFSEDEQETVVLLAVHNIVAALKCLIAEENKTHIAPILIALLNESKSWKVRIVIAEQSLELLTSVKDESVKADMLKPIASLFRDGEAEVRNAAVAKIDKIAALFGKQAAEDLLLELIKDLVTDNTPSVRATFALHFGALAPVFGKELTSAHLVPAFLVLLKDENPDVRLNLISKIEDIRDVIGLEALTQKILPSVSEIAADKQWRVRLAVVDYFPVLATQLGQQAFDAKLTSIVVSWLNDTVFSIREATIQTVKKLIKTFGEEWAKTNIFPVIVALCTNTNYLHRITAIMAITTLSEVIKPETMQEALLPNLIQLKEDSIPNVRFNVARAFETLLPYYKQPTLAQHFGDVVKPTLQHMTEDRDDDVKYFAQHALRGLESK